MQTIRNITTKIYIKYKVKMANEDGNPSVAAEPSTSSSETASTANTSDSVKNTNDSSTNNSDLNPGKKLVEKLTIQRLPISAVVTNNLTFLDEILQSDRFTNFKEKRKTDEKANVEKCDKDSSFAEQTNKQGTEEQQTSDNIKSENTDVENMDCDEVNEKQTDEPVTDDVNNKQTDKPVASQKTCSQEQMELNLAMVAAVSSQQPAMLEKLLEAGADLYAFDDWYPVLHSILDTQSTHMLNVAIKYAKHIDTVGYYGNLLNTAARSGSLELITKVFELGAKEFIHCKANGSTPLHEAVRSVPYTVNQSKTEGSPQTISNTEVVYDLSVISFLIENGCAIDGKDSTDKTALHYAAIIGNEKVVKYLVHAGANRQAVDKEKHTPWMKAALYQHNNLLEDLLDVSLIDQPVQEDGDLLTQFASTNDLPTALQFLLDKGANPVAVSSNESSTPLRMAIINKSMKCIKVLLNHPNCGLNISSNGETPFQKMMVMFSSYDNPDGHEIMDIFLRKGCQVDEKNEHGATPLFHVMSHNAAAATWLLSHGANPDHIMPDGRYPLLAACSSNDKDLLTLLLQYNADVTMTDRSDQNSNLTPLQFVLKNHHQLIKICLVAGFSLYGVHDMLRLEQDLVPNLISNSSEMEALVKYIHSKPHAPMTLRGLSRIKVLRCLGVKDRNSNLLQLGLPSVLEKYLQWDSYFEMRRNDFERCLSALK